MLFVIVFGMNFAFVDANAGALSHCEVFSTSSTPFVPRPVRSVLVW